MLPHLMSMLFQSSACSCNRTERRRRPILATCSLCRDSGSGFVKRRWQYHPARIHIPSGIWSRLDPRGNLHQHNRATAVEHLVGRTNRDRWYLVDSRTLA